MEEDRSVETHYDRETELLWLRFGDRSGVVEAEEFADGVLVEFDEDGRVVGIEPRRTMERVLNGHKTASEKPYLANALASETV